MTQPMRVYADTSVYGGVFDEQFVDASQIFFDQINSGRFALVVSEVVERELAAAPAQVREFYERIRLNAEVAALSTEVLELRDAYVNARIVSRKSLTDALHVAVASFHRCSILVSWNCRHIVHFNKIPQYNAVNTLRGITQLSIHTPAEVTLYEE